MNSPFGPVRAMGDSEEFEFTSICKDLWLRPFPDVFAAAWVGSLNGVRKFVEKDDSDASRPDETPLGERNTALHYAAAKGYIEIVEYLLEKRASINAKNIHGVNPLFLAVQSQHVEIVQKLLSVSDLSLVERKSNLTIGDLCSIAEEDDIDDDDGDSRQKNEEIRELLVDKSEDFTKSVDVEIVRVGATTVALRWPIPETYGATLPVTKSIVSVYDDTEGESDEPCKQHTKVTTVANATTFEGQLVHKHVVRSLRPRGRYSFSIRLDTALQEGPEGPRSDTVQLIREPDKVASVSCVESKKLDSAKLSWKPPVQNGGAEVSGYQIQMTRVSGTMQANPTGT